MHQNSLPIAFVNDSSAILPETFLSSTWPDIQTFNFSFGFQTMGVTMCTKFQETWFQRTWIKDSYSVV